MIEADDSRSEVTPPTGMLAGAWAPRDVWRRGKGFLTDLAWVARSGFSATRRRTLVVVVCLGASVTSVAVLVGGLTVIARAVEQDEVVQVGPLEASAALVRDSLGPVVGVVTFLALIAVLGVYLGERGLEHLARRHQLRLTEQILDALVHPSARGWPDHLPPSSSPEKGLARLIATNVRWTALAYRDLVSLVLPLSALLVALAGLLLLDRTLTLLLMPVGLAYLVMLYRVNRGVAQSQRDLRRMMRPARRSLLDGLRQVVVAGPQGRPDRAAATSPEYLAATDAFYDRIVAVKQTRSLSNALFVVAAGLVFVSSAGFLGGGEASDFAGLVAFLVALRVARGAVGSVAVTFTKLSRFMPEFSGVADLDRWVRARRQADAAPLEGDEVAVRPGTQAVLPSTRVVWSRHRVLLVAVDERVDLTLLGTVAARLEARLALSVPMAPAATLVARGEEVGAVAAGPVVLDGRGLRTLPTSCPFPVVVTGVEGLEGLLAEEDVAGMVAYAGPDVVVVSDPGSAREVVADIAEAMEARRGSAEEEDDDDMDLM